MSAQPDQPFRPPDQPASQPAVPTSAEVPAGDGGPTPPASVSQYPPEQLATEQAVSPSRTRRILQVGAVGVAGLVAGSALTFAVTANGNVTGSNDTGPGSGQFRGSGARGGLPGYFPDGRAGQAPDPNGQAVQDGSDQGQAAPSTQPSTQPG